MLALLNDIPIMTIAYDRTNLPSTPVRWDMHRVITMALVLGGIGLIETFLLLVLADSVFQLPFAQLQSIIFLKLSLAGHVTLFIVRARKWFWQKPYPAPILLTAILGTQAIAALIVGFGFLVTPIPWSYVGIIWLYCLLWMFVEDGAKVLVDSHMAHAVERHQKFIRVAKGLTPVKSHNGRALEIVKKLAMIFLAVYLIAPGALSFVGVALPYVGQAILQSIGIISGILMLVSITTFRADR
ncbi:MAG: hypothetical protein JSR46_03120, partial [Verrucomicrobia bacterium]|nr:hypothetical protein [Verrucomicrobiota bacterium]